MPIFDKTWDIDCSIRVYWFSIWMITGNKHSRGATLPFTILCCYILFNTSAVASAMTTSMESNLSYIYIYIYIYIYMWPGLGKQVLSTCKIWPDFESLKCNNFLSVISSVSKILSHMQKSMRNSIKLKEFG